MSSNAGHGREERREWWLLTDLSFFEPERLAAWRDLQAIARVTASRTIEGETSSQERYYLTSLSDVELVAHASRAHWDIENGLHWILDIAFGEDDSRTWVGNAQANLVTLRHMVLALLKRDTSSKVGIKARRRKAGWSTDYLLKVLNA